MTETSKYAKFAVLYVDDEEQALKYFQKGIGRDFQALTANSVEAALAILERDHHKIAVVLSDQRMPRQCGTELLKEVCTRWPHIMRILVTAYSELDSAIEAVNGGAIYKYLTKPVEFAKMREVLKSALDVFLERGERDQLLQIKMSSLRRMVVEDRVRSLNNLTFGLTHHLRNSVTAMGCFLEEFDPANTGPAPMSTPESAECARQLWALAVDERDRLIQMLEQFQRAVIDPTCAFNDELQPDKLLTETLASTQPNVAPDRLVVKAEAGLGTLKGDAARITDLLKILVTYVAQHGNAAGKINVTLSAAAPHRGAQAVQIRITGDGPAWTDQDVATFFTPFAFPKNDPSELGLGLLSTFSIAQQHGGDILVHRSAPLGPGFEVLLPVNPAEVKRADLEQNLLQTIFT
ncbi:MAG TPA: hybrid sensor histidine kinase/response regulator [Tepidisphaeraceae bacterium]|jgi:two-component system probable response regulator PhcQ|nr:hybrid sensor histidine kinase/response regulator [Tepidisphaeraceae bacterium]